MQQRETTTERNFRHWLQTCASSEQTTLAELWGVPPMEASDGASLPALADMILLPERVQDVLSRLNTQERAALERVQAEGGRIAAAILEREFGAIRPHQGYPNPRAYLLSLAATPSAVERLYVFGLLLVEKSGLRRTYSIPSDVLALLPSVPPHDRTLHLMAIAEPSVTVTANVWELELNILMILALAQAGDLIMAPGRGMNKASMVRLAKRWSMSKDDLRGLTYEHHWRYVHFLRLVLQSAGLLRVTTDQELRPTAATGEWLQLPRQERLRRLLDGWITSDWDELKHFLGIEIKGFAFDRDLAATHRAILGILAHVPPGAWINWETLLDEVLRVEPDFARPEGNYDTWRLVNYRRQNLDGFVHWRDVEGNVLTSTIGGSLRWLGLTDYGGEQKLGNEEESQPVAFRLTPLGAALLAVGPDPADPAYAPLVVQGNFEIVAPPHAAPFARFQLGRIAKWMSGNGYDEAEVYKLTKASVQAAAAQNIQAEEIIRFLEQTSGVSLAQNVVYSIREWAGQYGQLNLRRVALVQSDDPLLLVQLRRDQRLRLPPVETLDEQTWAVHEGDAARLATALRKAGYGLAGDIDLDGPELKERDLTMLAAALKFYISACTDLGIEYDASGAMIQRVARLLTQRQRDTADRIAHEALLALRETLLKKRNCVQ